MWCTFGKRYVEAQDQTRKIRKMCHVLIGLSKLNRLVSFKDSSALLLEEVIGCELILGCDGVK
jgi:hypothetical protein